MAVKTFSLNGQLVTAGPKQTILDAARDNHVEIPTLCQMDGLSVVGACRLCLVEVGGTGRLLPACSTRVHETMEVTTHTPRLEKYRRMILELLFAERNHVCSVCVSNEACELQDQAYDIGMTHVRFPYRTPDLSMDMTHDRFGLDHNRCILCTRCVRVCDEIEGAHTWDIMGRGADARVIVDLDSHWGSSSTCTSCGKCVQSCPTGALFEKGKSAAEMVKHRGVIADLQKARERRRNVGIQ